MRQQELLQDVRHAIDNLPPALHQIVELRFGRDMSYSEISVQFNLSPENTRKRVQQARSILRASCVEARSGDRTFHQLKTDTFMV